MPERSMLLRVQELVDHVDVNPFVVDAQSQDPQAVLVKVGDGLAAVLGAWRRQAKMEAILSP